MSRKVDSFEQFPEHDRAVTAWFAQNAWPVSARFANDHHDVFVWRFESISLDSQRTLRVTQNVLEDVPPSVLVEFMDGVSLARTLSRYPTKYIVIKQTDARATIVEVLDSPPR